MNLLALTADYILYYYIASPIDQYPTYVYEFTNKITIQIAQQFLFCSLKLL